LQHHAQHAVDAEPRVPEAGVGVVHFAFGLRGSMVSGDFNPDSRIRSAPRRDRFPGVISFRACAQALRSASRRS